ncbi:MAG TPA: GNAT family N-acetyltransferase [Thermodesulfovibrionales bacterium]|nr:GNAT family N-acetyltransferase [Thermodesulfovibrionales bacterium]
MNNSYIIEEAKEMGAEIYEALKTLIPQLSSSGSIPSQAQLEEMISSPATHLLLAREQGTRRIVGSLTLIIFRIPTGVRAWIEDVVVDSGSRGKGIGRMLCKAAIEEAKKANAKTVDLTSRPTREEANRLYRSVGFELRDTNVYRFTIY